MKLRYINSILAVCVATLLLFGNVVQANSEWREVTVYFNDGSNVQGELQSTEKALHFFYENEKVSVDMNLIRSLEVLSVNNKGKKPISTIRIELTDGKVVDVEMETSSSIWCYKGFKTKRRNPLTRIYEEKRYNWVGHSPELNRHACVFYEGKSREKTVIKVEYRDIK